MEDKELKSILKKDDSYPVRPKNEWSQISNRIESKKRSPFFLITSVATICFCIVIGVNSIQMKSVENDLEIADYLLEEKLFTENDDQLYAWVE